MDVVSVVPPQLVACGADVNHASRYVDGATPLHEAVAGNLIDMVRHLVQHRANPFVESMQGRPAVWAGPASREPDAA